jgi:hypothetical protein
VRGRVRAWVSGMFMGFLVRNDAKDRVLWADLLLL